MPTINFSDEEHAAVTAALRRTIADDKFPLSPRLAPLKAALAKLDPRSTPQPRPAPAALPKGAYAERGGRQARR